MHHRGLGMRIIGRLALAAALLVPVGVATANSAGASSGTVKCTIGATKVGISPGLLLSTNASQTLKVPSPNLPSSPGPLDACHGFGINGSASGTTMTFSVTTPKSVTCQSIIGVQINGTAKITWAASTHNGTTTAKFGVNFTSATTAHLRGTITTTSGNYLAGEHISADVSFPSIAPADQGGNCSNVQKIRTGLVKRH